MTKIRGAIIGFGKIAQTGHVPAYLDARINRRTRITAIAEPNPEYRKLAAQFFPEAQIYESVFETLRHESLDFIDICTPPDSHAQILKLCAGKGLHILCEKPFVRDLEQAREVSAILQQHPDLVFMPCHQYRYSPIWRPFSEFVRENPAGCRNLLQFTVCRMQADQGYFRDNPNWRTDHKISGGGILADTGVHYIYLMLWILGAPSSLSAHTANLHFRELRVEDTVIVMAECERGIAEITLTWAAGQRANSARLVNHFGGLLYNGAQLERTTAKGVENLRVPDASDKSQYAELYVSLIDEFAGRVIDRRPDPAWVDEAFRSIEILHACYRSAAEKRSIPFGKMATTPVQESRS